MSAGAVQVTATCPLPGVPETAVGAPGLVSTVKELDASLTYAMEMGLELSVWGRNLTNNRHLINIFDSPAQSGSVSGYPNQPRTYGGSVRYRF